MRQRGPLHQCMGWQGHGPSAQGVSSFLSLLPALPAYFELYCEMNGPSWPGLRPQQACTALALSKTVQAATKPCHRLQPDINGLPCGRHLGAGVTSLLTDTERLTTLIAGLSVLALGVYSAREGTRVGGRAFDRSGPPLITDPVSVCLQD